MANQHSPQSKIEVDGFYRPSIQPWVASLPRSAEGLTEGLNTLRNAIPLTASVLSQLFRLGRYVEPRDRVLGEDPLHRKSRAFMMGNSVGLVATAPLYLDNRQVLVAASRFIDKDLGADVRYLHGMDDIDTAHLRGEWLMSQGGFGLRCFSELQNDIEALVDSIEPDVTNQLFTKAGMGLGMLAVWEGFRGHDEERMRELAHSGMSDEDFTIGLHNLLNNQ